MTEPNPKLGAPFVAKVCRANPDHMLRRIMAWLPDASEQETWPVFRAKVLKDRDMLEACLRWFHVNARRRLEGFAPRTAPPKKRAVPLEEKHARVADRVKRIRAVMILDYTMPNGSRLRECTFGYAREVGGAFARLGEMGDPHAIIGQVLSNDAADAAVGEIGSDWVDPQLNGEATRPHRRPSAA
jgi:hypothetical protein